MLWAQLSFFTFDFNTQHPLIPDANNVRSALFGECAIIFSEDLLNRIISSGTLVLPGSASLLEVEPDQN